MNKLKVEDRKVRREYILTRYRQFTLRIIFEEKLYSFEFKGGTVYPKKKNGTFATSNPKLQAILESRPEYGKKYRWNKDTALKKNMHPDDITLVEHLGQKNLPLDKNDPIKVVGTVDVKASDSIPDGIRGNENVRKGKYIIPPEGLVFDEPVNFQKAKNAVFQHFKDQGMQWGEVNAQVDLEGFCTKNNIVFPNWVKKTPKK